jgi:hypothetical protein
MLTALFNHWKNSTEAIKDVQGLVWALSMEPLPPAIYNHAAPGSNSLGISGTRKDSLVVSLLAARWSLITDDDLVTNTATTLINNIKTDAQRLGQYDKFQYLNYAAPSQTPILNYGAESVARLRKVSAKYDPLGVFQKQVPGGFKLP